MGDWLELHIDDGGIGQAALVFERIRADLVSGAVKTAAWQAAHKVMCEVSREHFAAEGAGSQHGAWVPYGPGEARYVAIKRHLLGSELPKLQWRAGEKRLGPSIWNPQHKEHIGRVMAGGSGFEFGTAVPYAAQHQLGGGTLPERYRTLDGPHDVPRRRVIDFSDRQLRRIYRVMFDTFRAAINKRLPKQITIAGTEAP